MCVSVAPVAKGAGGGSGGRVSRGRVRQEDMPEYAWSRLGCAYTVGQRSGVGSGGERGGGLALGYLVIQNGSSTTLARRLFESIQVPPQPLHDLRGTAA